MVEKKKNVTIYDVCTEANVSLATVSRVVNNIEKVAPATRQKVQDAIKKLNYKPSALARGLVTNKTTSIAIIVPHVNFLHSSNVLAGLIDVANIYSYHCSIYSYNPEYGNSLEDILNSVLSLRADGVIVYNISIERELLGQLNVPTLLISNDDVPSDNVEFLRLAFKEEVKKVFDNYLKNNLAQPLNFIKINVNDSITEQCYDAFAASLKSNDRTISQVIEIDNSYTKVYNYFKEYFVNFSESKKGLYVFTRDSLAIAALNAALDSGLDVPNDVELIAFLGTKYSKMMRPRMASFSIDMYEVGMIAMRILTKMLIDDRRDLQSIIACEFNKGETMKQR